MHFGEDTFPDPFGDSLNDATAQILEKQMRTYEKSYFPAVSPIDRLDVTNINGPAELLLYNGERILRINPVVSKYPHLCGLLILHELINNKFLLDGRLLVNGKPLYETDKVAYEMLIQPEIERLWKEGAYKGLL